MLLRFLCCATVLISSLLAADAQAAAKDLPLDAIKLPEGFKISLFASEVPNARSLARAPGGTVFVSTRGQGNLYAVVDEDNDHVAEKTYTIAKGMHMPNGVAFRDGSLYVAEVSRILRYDDIESKLSAPPEPVVVLDTLPKDEHHGWKYLVFGPDGKLYFQIGSPENIGNREEEDPRYASIMRVNADGSDLEIYAHGVRNSLGLAWHPQTGELWFTDNGRDFLGDDSPACELNRAATSGLHFGYPYCHGGEIPDPEFAAGRDCSEFVAPAQKLGPHVAPLGLKFYTGTMFPEEYRNQIFLAEHGSFNRTIPIGYCISLVRLDASGNPASYETFAEGWLQRAEAWGRPVDVLIQPDGSMLVSDDKSGVIYRISYDAG